MTKTLKVGNDNIQFPDETTDEEMSQAAQSHLATTQQQPGRLDALKNYVTGLPEKAFDSANQFLTNAPSNVLGYVGNMIPNNTRNARLAGAGIVKGATNTILGLGNHGNDLMNTVAPKDKQFQDVNFDPQIDKFFGVADKQPGDTIGNFMGGAALAAINPESAEAIAAKFPKMGAAAEAANVIQPESAEIQAMRQRKAELAEQALQTKAAQDKAIAESQNAVKASNPETMEHDARQAEQDMKDLKQNNDAYHHQLANITGPGELPMMDNDHIDAVDSHAKNLDEVQSAIDQNQNHVTNLENQLAEHDKGLDQFFGKGSEHDVAIAKNLQQQHEAVEKHGSDAYGLLNDATKDRPARSRPDSGIELEKARLREENPANPVVDLILNNLPSGSEKTVSDLLTTYKEFKNQRRALVYGLRDDPSAVSRAERIRVHGETEELQKHFDRSLNEQLGPYSEDLKKINDFYSKVIFPLRDNPIIKTANEKGRLGPNIAADLRGQPIGDAGIAQQHVRGMIMNDPENVKNVLGQRYSNSQNGKAVLNPNSTVQRYLDNHPEAKGLVQNRNEVNANLEAAKKNLSNLQDTHNTVSENYKEAVKNAGEIEKERAKAIRDHADETLKAQKQRDALNQTIAKNENSIKALQDRHAQLMEQIPKLREAFNKHNQTIKQKNANGIALQKALDEAKSTKGKIKAGGKSFLRTLVKHKIKSTLGLGGSIYGGYNYFGSNDPYS